MHPALGVRREVLIKSYRLYLDVDRNGTIAVKGARRWFPAGGRPGAMIVGDPHSKIGKFYEVREHALNRLLLAREKLENARLWLARRQRQDRVTPGSLC